MELKQAARNVHASVGDEATELPNGLINDGRRGRVEALVNGLSAGIGIGVQILRSRSKLREDRDDGEFLERGLGNPEFLQQGRVGIH